MWDLRNSRQSLSGCDTVHLGSYVPVFRTNCYCCLYGRRYLSTVGVETRPQAGYPDFDSRHGRGNFIPSNVQPDTGVHPHPYSEGTGSKLTFGRGIKRPQYAVDHSPPPRVKVKNEWKYNSTPPACLRRVHRDKFTFLPWRQRQQVPLNRTNYTSSHSSKDILILPTCNNLKSHY